MRRAIYYLITRSTLQKRALAILRRFGTNAHVYLPGIGTLSGLQAANYLDSALTTPATVDNPVGGVVDAIGVINATQATTASKPILRQTAGKYSWAFDGGDSLSLGSVPFTQADDRAVIASGRVDVATGNHVIFSCSGAAARLGQLVVQSLNINSVDVDDAASNGNIVGISTAISTTFVATNVSRSGIRALRVNGIQRGTSNTVLGATTITQTNIGTNSASSSLTGSTGPILAIKGTLTDSEMLTLERLVSNLTPNAPSF